MKIWFVSRHPGALHWMQRNNIVFDEHVAHLEPNQVNQGDKVIGSLPVNLAAKIQERGAEYWNLSLIMPASARGQELSADELEQFNAQLEQYQVKFIQAFTIPASVTEEPEQEISIEPETKTEEDLEEALPSKIEVNPGAWARKVFNLHAWGDSNAHRILEQFFHLTAQMPNAQGRPIYSSLKTAARHGTSAREFFLQLEPLLKSKQFDEAAQFVNEIKKQGRSKRITDYLEHKVSRAKDFLLKKEQAAQNAPKKPTYYIPKLAKVELHNGQHPQALKNLKPSKRWTILIDETNKEFQLDYTGLTADKIGKFVALVLPSDTSLAPLTETTHSADLPIEQVEQLITSIVQAECGVFGASMDGVLAAHSWGAGLEQFIHLLLLMLPVDKKTFTEVNIYVEGRSSYEETNQLLILSETIENELKLLSPSSFTNLHLNLQIMNKEHRFNGYVDAIGNCWGSPTRAKRELLKRTRWLNHCLLNKGNLSEIEQLYLSIKQGRVTPEAWFNLCDFAAFEPEHSIFNNLLDELGKKSQANTTLWQSYLQHLQYRMATKNYNAGNLSRALAWLNDYKANQDLPASLELQLVSSQLAASNHRGQEDISLASRVIELANQLQDEAATEVCQALLRLAISATHNFDFTSFKPILEQWLAYPVAVPGLANYAKLHSTLGQLLAFQGETEQSIKEFETAISLFKKLSDSAQAAREIRQTQIYQAICMMDGQHPQAVSFTQKLLNNKDLNGATSERFSRYLLLRLLTHFPELTDERERYLNKQKNWQIGEGHPWMLINAYRGWLLAENGEAEIAKEYFEAAVTECSDSDNGAILQWMGQVLAALAIGLGCQLEFPNAEASFNAYPQEKLQELTNKQLKHADRICLLAQLLPFNFH